MPQYYYLYTTSSGGLVYTGYVIRVTGPNNQAVNVMTAAAAHGQTPPLPPPGPWSTMRAVRTGSGKPEDPASGDTLTLTATVGGNDISGPGTFGPSGAKGPGYYPGQGPKEEEGDWCAGAN